jgi:hypothetical protein
MKPIVCLASLIRAPVPIWLARPSLLYEASTIRQGCGGRFPPTPYLGSITGCHCTEMNDYTSD